MFPRTRNLERQLLEEVLQIKAESNYVEYGEDLFTRWSNLTQQPQTESGLSKNLESFSFCEFKERLNKIKTCSFELKKVLIKETLILIYPLVKNGAFKSEDKEIKIVGIPIASNKLFYGYLLVGFLQDKNKGIDKKLHDELKKRAKKSYLPALILCHHSFYEKLYAGNPSQLNGNEEDMPFFCNDIQGSSSTLEKNIHILWSLRNSNKDKLDKIKTSHFVFQDYLWASPATIQQIEKALTWDINFKKNNDSSKQKPKLKTFLIAGGPGSGKETLAKMIGLFSSGHTFSKPNFFNMASLKPAWIAPPSLVGIEAKVNIINFSLRGIFAKVLDKTRANKDKNPIVVLDELNSLDVDAQGTLLRILENDEVVPIGGIDCAIKEDIVKKLLVIGIVNELPPHLTLEDTLRTLSQDRELWGNLLGSALYEFYRGMRRLRDDLYYRFSRGGYIELPDLDKRREDIPIIFFTSLPKVLREKLYNNTREKFIEYDVWALLTDERIKWKGNVRQLQAVANMVAQKATKKDKDIDVPMVRKVLKRMYLLLGEKDDDDDDDD
ncbi:MAG TPA: sigma 54-interacting transcriptional regulator [Candidatus Brocadiia bacterium]|nr:sigma 54-interacting transcriptional regulator [Candidatus Brocadiales bacterium]